MFPLEFASWTDLLLDHYVFSVIISILVVAVTFFISKTNKHSNIDAKTSCTSTSVSDAECKENPESLLMSAASCLTRSPALRAEKLIEANMTEEQRLLEREVRQKQLAQIYELMQKQSDKFGNISLTEVEEQMKLYQCK